MGGENWVLSDSILLGVLSLHEFEIQALITL